MSLVLLIVSFATADHGLTGFGTISARTTRGFTPPPILNRGSPTDSSILSCKPAVHECLPHRADQSNRPTFTPFVLGAASAGGLPTRGPSPGLVFSAGLYGRPRADFAPWSPCGTDSITALRRLLRAVHHGVLARRPTRRWRSSHRSAPTAPRAPSHLAGRPSAFALQTHPPRAPLP
jgi:hypothetical protein